MKNTAPQILVAGHICLDIIPTLREGWQEPGSLRPGSLVHVGPAVIGLGGCVANTGLALHRLGAATRIVAKLGRDALGKLVLDLLSQFGPQLTEHLIVDEAEATSYSIVISPPDVDRSFLHSPAANDSFSARELDLEILAGAKILHFGYPPLMKNVVADGGQGLAALFRAAQGRGMLTSLDMAMPDRTGNVQCNWAAWLQTVLPHVDIFLPSFDEILLMLDSERLSQLTRSNRASNLAASADFRLLEHLGDSLVELGSPINVIKLGDQGLYLHTSHRTSQLLNSRSFWKEQDWHKWEKLQAISPCLDVDVVGTTGAGDCTIAGLLMALLRGYGPDESLQVATTVGALCVQSPDAISNITSWNDVQRLVDAPLPRRQSKLIPADWVVCQRTGVFRRPG